MPEPGRQLDVAHALAPDLGLDHFNTALLAHHAAMAHSLILAAVAFVIFGRSENFRAEESVALRFESPIVDRLRFFYFAVRPRADFFRRSDRHFDRVEQQ